MDQKLCKYLYKLRGKYPQYKFPKFSTRYSYDINEKKILVILQDPGNSGADESGECCIIKNTDTTSRNQRSVIIDDLDLPLEQVLFWNFYPYFGWEEDFNQRKSKLRTRAAKIKFKRDEQIKWAKEMQYLTRIMKNLRVIVVSGSETWDGMKYFKPTNGIPLVWTPHPSGRGLTLGNREIYTIQWHYASYMAFGSR